MGATLRLCSGKFKAQFPIGAAPRNTLRRCQIAQQPIGGFACLALVMRPAENTAGVCKSCGIGPTTSMPSTCFSSLICCTARSASPLTSRSAVKPCSTMLALAADLGRTPSLDQLGRDRRRSRPAANRRRTAPQAVFCGGGSAADIGMRLPARTAMPTKERARSAALPGPRGPRRSSRRAPHG